MKKELLVSIQVAAYCGTLQLSKILEGIFLQETDHKLQINILANDSVPDLEAFLADVDFKGIPYRIIRESSDGFGLDNVDGDYVAFCCFDDAWIVPDKLQRQISLLEEEPQYSASVHDTDLINENGLPYRYAVQRKYKKQRFVSDKIYTWKWLEKGIFPGTISSLVCRNIFHEAAVKTWISADEENFMHRLFTALAFSGDLYNFSNEIMASRLIQNPSESVTSALSYEDAQKGIQYLEDFAQYATVHGGHVVDRRYRFIQIASLNFEYYKKSGKSSEQLQQFMELYDLAYQPIYDLPVDECHEYAHEKVFFEFLRRKVYWYLIGKGTKEELPLLKYLNLQNDEVRIEHALQCYKKSGSANTLVRQQIIEGADNVPFVKKEVRRRLVSAPFRKIKRKVEQIGKKLHRNFKRVITRRLRKQGYSDYMANEWYDTVRVNLFTDKETPLKKKLWCYKRGFMPWRLFQYGLTEENYQTFLSDRDYMYLHQINNSYKKWIEDKMTFRYVLEPFKEYLPKYYYQIIRREGCNVLVSLMDCPEGYEATFDDLFRLLRDKGALALKAASGTHGIGFYKMSYEDGKYYMNNVESSEYEIRQIIHNFKNFYIVTEYITMHDEIKRLYGGSVNTLRVMMINRTAHDPQILDAYMRIGSSSTGTTDNVAFGGVFCRIDIETGEYGNAEQSKNHVLVACPYHPDTQEPVQGIIPHWELIKEKIIEISNYMCQLEYLGFDIVCTPDGFTILEINSHQDLHRYIYYDERIKKFYFDKLEYKNRLYKKK